jgi:hypothetical protein
MGRYGITCYSLARIIVVSILGSMKQQVEKRHAGIGSTSGTHLPLLRQPQQLQLGVPTDLPRVPTDLPRVPTHSSIKRLKDSSMFDRVLQSHPIGHEDATKFPQTLAIQDLKYLLSD